MALLALLTVLGTAMPAPKPFPKPPAPPIAADDIVGMRKGGYGDGADYLFLFLPDGTFRDGTCRIAVLRGFGFPDEPYVFKGTWRLDGDLLSAVERAPSGTEHRWSVRVAKGKGGAMVLRDGRGRWCPTLLGAKE